jgi:hypothetical protein
VYSQVIRSGRAERSGRGIEFTGTSEETLIFRIRYHGGRHEAP